MAKYEVNHACGHVRVVEMFGRFEDRRGVFGRWSRLAWLAKKPYPQCEKEEKE